MVEHLLCKQGVIGSNPIASTRAFGPGVMAMGFVLPGPAYRCEEAKQLRRAWRVASDVRRGLCASWVWVRRWLWIRVWSLKV